jgi:acyl-CoA synthetase (AMP-forming)/AMP-acid ligase II
MDFNLADLFECVVDHAPERTAVVCGDSRVTYAQLESRANRVAHALAALGVAAGDHVGLYLHDTVEHLEAMLGCYKARAVPVNVNHRYVDRELAYLFTDADLVAVVYEQENRTRFDTARADCPRLRVALEIGDGSAPSAGPETRATVDYETVLAAAPAVRDFGTRSADDRYILYTGGTTGLPKGVVWRQEDIFFAALGGGNPGGPPITAPEALGRSVVENRAQRLAAFLPAGAVPPEQFVSCSLGPLMHASGQWSALGTLLGGGRVVLTGERHLDLAHVLDLVERERIGALNMVGDATARPLLDLLEASPGRWDTSSLVLVGSGGSILSGDVKARLLAALPSVVAILDGIGSSESPAQAVALTTRTGAPTPSLTFTAKDTTIVVDDDLRPIPPGSGAVGRLATRGRVPLGYYKDDERSSATFVEIDGARWSLPGDMATIDADGTVRLLGRGSLCINTGG